jgi:hypothetical protein
MKLREMIVKGLYGRKEWLVLEIDNIRYPTPVKRVPGPAGAGKTTFLNILYSFFQEEWIFFYNLPFEEIEITFCDSEIVDYIEQSVSNVIRITKSEDGNVINIDCIYKTDNSKIRVDFTNHKSEALNFNDVETWEDNDIWDGMAYTIKGYMPDIYAIIKSFNVFKISLPCDRDWIKMISGLIMHHIKNECIRVSQILEDRHVNIAYRLLSGQISKQAGILPVEEAVKAYLNIMDDMEVLMKYGLINGSEKNSHEGNLWELDIHKLYENGNGNYVAAILDVYREKIKEFGSTVKRFQVFEKYLTRVFYGDKTFKFTFEEGFSIHSKNLDRRLGVECLSSSEKNFLYLIYNLLFEVKYGENTLLLIDNPECSSYEKTAEAAKELLHEIEDTMGHPTVITATNSIFFN